MKKLFCFVFVVCTFYFISAQSSLPDVKIKSLKGEEFLFSSLGTNSDTAIIVSLWATWCVPCILELETIKELYDEKQKEVPFKVLSIFEKVLLHCPLHNHCAGKQFCLF